VPEQASCLTISASLFSILILSLNEETNLHACLDSISWCDDIVLLDSFSTDRTTDIARLRGIRVFQRRFDDFGHQRNYALREIRFKYRWVFHLDADERFNDSLRRECERVITLDCHSGYAVPNRIIFLGRWIKHCTQYPFPQVRLVRIGEMSFAKAGHGQGEENAIRGIGYIQTPFDHFNFSKGLSHWIYKHDQYSTEEARLAIAHRAQHVEWRQVFSADNLTRKRVLKHIQSRLPLRWLWKFAWLYIIRRGFLDGYPGFIYCILQTFYDLLICLKVQELDFMTQTGKEFLVKRPIEAKCLKASPNLLRSRERTKF
jgi:glycosyltransferase involved in cell wall biosynthesis